MNKKIQYTPQFKRHFKQRIGNNTLLKNLIAETIDLFIEDPHHPTLNNHKLSGSMQGLRAISVELDWRIIYFETRKWYILMDVGTHEQVYKP